MEKEILVIWYRVWIYKDKKFSGTETLKHAYPGNWKTNEVRKKIIKEWKEALNKDIRVSIINWEIMKLTEE